MKSLQMLSKASFDSCYKTNYKSIPDCLYAQSSFKEGRKWAWKKMFEAGAGWEGSSSLQVTWALQHCYHFAGCKHTVEIDHEVLKHQKMDVCTVYTENCYVVQRNNSNITECFETRLFPKPTVIKKQALSFFCI